jgi:hypothetical protein
VSDDVTAIVDGLSYSGTYSLHGHSITVTSPYGETTRRLVNSAAAAATARFLLEVQVRVFSATSNETKK